MRELAAFASSEEGRIYARTHQTWGTDPAAFLEQEDDVLAYNLRVALMLRLGQESTERPELDPQARSHRAGMQRSHQASQALKAALHG